MTVKNKFLTLLLQILLVLFFNNTSIAQELQSNLEVFFKLIDSSVTKINSNLPDQKGIYLKTILPNDYVVFQNRIISGFNNLGKNVHLNNTESYPEVQYSIHDAKVSYDEVFRSNLFGSYKVNRKISLNVDYILLNNNEVKSSESFKMFSSDTIPYDDLVRMEISNLSFTKSEIPSEPFFSSILEPLIAVGAAAVTIYLFFTVRSK